MTRILVVDDEPQILRALAANLRARGYEVDLAGTGEAALTLAQRHRPDAVVLDLGLPGIDGLEVIRGLRGWTEVPIVVLSVREAEADKIAALDAGADDFVTKPFGMGELLARLRAALRRATPVGEAAVVTTEHFTVDLAAKRVRDGNDDEVRLTPTEWAIVELLVRNPGRLVSQRQLLHEVWGRSTRRRRTTCVCTSPRSAGSSSQTRRARATSSQSRGWATASSPDRRTPGGCPASAVPI